VSPLARRIPLPSGLSLNVVEWGGDGPLDHTVILLHGFLENAWAWEETVESGLAGRFHIVSVDLRGHGDSDRVGPGGDYYFPDYLADLHDLMPLVARARLSLVGHSMGGVVAGYYAGISPDQVSRLALLEGTGLPNPPKLGAPERVARWFSRRRIVRGRPQSSYASVEEAADRLRKSDPTLRPNLALRLAERGTSLGPDGRRRFKHDVRLTAGRACALDVEHLRVFWKRVTCPVLLVEGERSEIRLPPEEAQRRWSAFARHRSVVLPEAGHMMQRDQPAALARLLVEFLSEA
jgi:pimeloyl-ACP methyl ester carboxylesterase